jgi:hypothetical protein
LFGCRQPERESDSVQRSDPVRVAGHDDRREPIRLLRNRERECASGLGFAAPEQPRFGPGREAGHAPGDAAIVARRNRHGRRDHDRAGAVGRRNREGVFVDRARAHRDGELVRIERPRARAEPRARNRDDEVAREQHDERCGKENEHDDDRAAVFVRRQRGWRCRRRRNGRGGRRHRDGRVRH